MTITDVKYSLCSCLLIACGLALFLTHRLDYVAKPLSTDDFLLFVSMSGSLIFELAVIIAAFNHFGFHDSTLMGLDLTASIMATSQTILQVSIYKIQLLKRGLLIIY
jgi:hypothetical protein